MSIGLGGCASTTEQIPPTQGERTGVQVSQRLTVGPQHLPVTKLAPVESIAAADVRSWVVRQPADSVSPDFIRRYAQRKESLPLRLVGTLKDHPALAEVVARAKLTVHEGFPAGSFGLDALERAQARLERDRVALRDSVTEGQRAAARNAVAASAQEVELHAWRVAHRLGQLLGGSVWSTVVKTFETLLIAEPASALAAIEPDDPSYHALVAGLQRYRELARGEDAGTGLGKVRSTIRWLRLRGGKRSSRVERLRRRLAAEGFIAPPKEGAADYFDPGLVKALAQFQRHNGLPDSGRLNSLTFKALKVPVSIRADRIAQALTTLRQSPARRSPYRIVVNIPAFRLRLLDGGKQVVTHRVVVGNNKRVYDANTGRTRFGNRTPVLASKVRQLVLNPAWRVPRRIKENELDRRAEYRPEIYDDYRFYYDRAGVEWAVQLPGPRNALGRVKFVFSGGNGVYLHDTPKKKDFRKDYRALSHGCVRVQDALGLAKTLLERDNNRVRWGVARSILRGRRETPVRLNRPVAIHLEYRLVGSEDGELRFYPDIYRKYVVKKRR